MSRIFGATTCTLLRPIILNSYKGILRSLASGESSLDKSKDVYYLETLSMNRVGVQFISVFTFFYNLHLSDNKFLESMPRLLHGQRIRIWHYSLGCFILFNADLILTNTKPFFLTILCIAIPIF